MLHVRQSYDLGDVVLEFSGALDLHSAQDIAMVGNQQPEALRLVIDLERASRIDDLALGELGYALRARAHSIRGVNRQRSRLLDCIEAGSNQAGHDLAHND